MIKCLFFFHTIAFLYSNVFFLSGENKKTWILYDSSSSEICRSVHSDNVYTFFSSGVFEFGNGVIVQDPNCNTDDCCGDMVNLVGKWELLNDDTYLRVTALRPKDSNDSNFEPIVLFYGRIDHLDEDVLKLSQVNPNDNVRYTFEFRKK